MARFTPGDPFPPFILGKHTYAEAQAHAAEADAWLGFKLAPIEKKLAEIGCRSRAPGASGERQELWFGLETQMLLTPYMEIRALLESLKPRPGQSFIDLGAGYGRMGFVLGRCFPGTKFVGYEYVGERVIEGRRVLSKFNYPGIRLEHADLAAESFEPDAADVYFIYDYGTPKAVEKTLYDLKRMAAEKPITLVGRGRHCRYLIERSHPWLVKSDPKAPESRTTVYSSYVESGSNRLWLTA